MNHGTETTETTALLYKTASKRLCPLIDATPDGFPDELTDAAFAAVNEWAQEAAERLVCIFQGVTDCQASASQS